MYRLKRMLRKFGRKLGRYFWSAQNAELGRCAFSDMKRFLPSDAAPLIIDVGGHIGDSVALFKKAFPSSMIHSFEPSPQSFEKLKQNTARDSEVFLWNCAMGAVAGKKTLLQNESSGMSSFLQLGEFGWGQIEKESIVDVTTLDSFLAGHGIERVDILKSDTQGYELEVLKGAEEALRRNRIGLIYLELIFSPMYKGQPPFHQIFQHLAACNFALVSIYGIQYQRNLADWADALFVNREYFGKRER